MPSTDFIVIGSGIAGLRAALELAKIGHVRVFCKGDPWESNTRWAQGGIAAAMQEGDTVEFHLQDTLLAGDDLCYEPAVRILVEEGPKRIQELIGRGAEFDQVGGRLSLAGKALIVTIASCTLAMQRATKSFALF